jgi:hypothetical protein
MKFVDLLHDVKDEGQIYHAGERRLLDDSKASYFCGVGWAKDAEGELPTGILDLSHKTLEVHNSRNGHSAPDKR